MAPQNMSGPECVWQDLPIHPACHVWSWRSHFRQCEVDRKISTHLRLRSAFSSANVISWSEWLELRGLMFVVLFCLDRDPPSMLF